jgi:BirA family transcriptional regulator, biotin operon repressor / biotin---[acetyl-CoA-carboxylase] ligase
VASGSAAFGTPRRHFRVTDSTNERARDLAAAGATSGTIVTAAEQTEGRG